MAAQAQVKRLSRFRVTRSVIVLVTLCFIFLALYIVLFNFCVIEHDRGTAYYPLWLTEKIEKMVTTAKSRSAAIEMYGIAAVRMAIDEMSIAKAITTVALLLVYQAVFTTLTVAFGLIGIHTRQPLFQNSPRRAMFMTDVASNRTKVFISYSHKDVRALQRLQTFLKPLEREGLLERWDDTNIRTGQQWRKEIEKALDAAKVAILLISADFLASDFIYNNELPNLLAAEEKQGLVVMPVILSPCRFDRIPNLSRFQSVNSPDKPLTSLSKAGRDAVWDKLVRDIEAVLHPSSPTNTDRTLGAM